MQGGTGRFLKNIIQAPRAAIQPQALYSNYTPKFVALSHNEPRWWWFDQHNFLQSMRNIYSYTAHRLPYLPFYFFRVFTSYLRSHDFILSLNNVILSHSIIKLKTHVIYTSFFVRHPRFYHLSIHKNSVHA